MRRSDAVTRILTEFSTGWAFVISETSTVWGLPSQVTVVDFASLVWQPLVEALYKVCDFRRDLMPNYLL